MNEETDKELQTLDPMDHEESDRIGFSYKGDLQENETISGTPVVTAEVVEGRDASPNAIINGPASINTAEEYIVQLVTARVPNVTYKLRCKITLSSGRVLVKSGYLPVIRYR